MDHYGYYIDDAMSPWSAKYESYGSDIVSTSPTLTEPNLKSCSVVEEINSNKILALPEYEDNWVIMMVYQKTLR